MLLLTRRGCSTLSVELDSRSIVDSAKEDNEFGSIFIEWQAFSNFSFALQPSYSRRTRQTGRVASGAEGNTVVEKAAAREFAVSSQSLALGFMVDSGYKSSPYIGFMLKRSSYDLVTEDDETYVTNSGVIPELSAGYRAVWDQFVFRSGVTLRSEYAVTEDKVAWKARFDVLNFGGDAIGPTKMV